MEENKIAFLYICHKSTPQAIINLQKICNEVKNCDIWVINDITNDWLDEKLPNNCNLWSFNRQSIEKMGFDFQYYYPTPTPCDFYGNNFDYVFEAFYLTHKNYDYYWSIEFDVWFEGNWNDLLIKYKNDDTDFITSRYGQLDMESVWAKTLLRGNLQDCKLQKPICKSFNPIMRFSKWALDYLSQLGLSNIFGFYEWFYPTMLNNAGYSIKNWEEETDDTVKFIGDGGSLVCKFEKGMLYHPVKEIVEEYES